MTWFCAHILVAVVPAGAAAWPQVVHENVYLIEAVDEDAAWERAESIGRDHAVAQGSAHEGEKVFRSEFAGVRKIISINNPSPLLQDEDSPVSGSGVTYSFFEVQSAKELEELSGGGSVAVTYIE